MRRYAPVLGILAIAGLDYCALTASDGAVKALALLAVAGLFALGFAELKAAERPRAIAAPNCARWTEPSEAAAAFGPLDRLIVTCAGLASFALSFVNYWVPGDKIFDEVYFARAAEEYLRNAYIYENTHPPLTKLIVTLSVWLFGGLPRGDTSAGWRFLDVVFSALAVMVLYALAKRLTGSTSWAALAAAFFTLDGMHFVQSRIGTPEGIVIFFSLAATYALYRFWIAAQSAGPGLPRAPARSLAVAAALSLGAGAAAAAVAKSAWPGLDTAAGWIIALYCAGGFYLAGAAAIRARLREPLTARRGALGWLVAFGVASGCLVGSKWYGVTLLLLAAVLLAWQRPRAIRADTAVVVLLFCFVTTYGLVWAPDLARQSPDPGEIHTLNDVVYRQYTMFEYHETLRATHPYSSKWWEWPLDEVPIVYYYTPAPQATPAACCVREITSMPNPLILWFGLLAVPAVAVLAWRERNRAYAFTVLAYVLQWLPWAESPRLTWEYHFYVDVPLICLCDAIALQRFWEWARPRVEMRRLAVAGVAAYALAVAIAFVYFYPVLAAVPIPWGAWEARMWFPTWIIGPG